MRHTTDPPEHIPIDITRFGDRRAQYECVVCGHRWEGEVVKSQVDTVEVTFLSRGPDGLTIPPRRIETMRGPRDDDPED